MRASPLSPLRTESSFSSTPPPVDLLRRVTSPSSNARVPPGRRFDSSRTKEEVSENPRRRIPPGQVDVDLRGAARVTLLGERVARRGGTRVVGGLAAVAALLPLLQAGVVEPLGARAGR